MKAELIAWMTVAWQALLGNSRFMTWNLFLALVPLALSFWLFHPPRSRKLLWGVLFLLGATFLPSIRHVLKHGIHLIRDLGMTYLVGAIAITLLLMGLDLWQLHRRQQSSRSLRWWVGFLAFVAFLPNAPYVLTDVIHLIKDIRHGYSVWIVTLALIPQYLLFIGIGFEAYVLSLMNLGDYLRRQGWGKFILWAELLLHFLSAIGIYLGRFIRFNSWDIITNPDALVDSVVDDLIGKRPVLVMFVTFVVITVLYWLSKQLTLGILQRTSEAAVPSAPTPAPESSTVQS